MVLVYCRCFHEASGSLLFVVRLFWGVVGHCQRFDSSGWLRIIVRFFWCYCVVVDIFMKVLRGCELLQDFCGS